MFSLIIQICSTAINILFLVQQLFRGVHAPSPSGSARARRSAMHVKCSEMYLNTNRNHTQQKRRRKVDG